MIWFFCCISSFFLALYITVHFTWRLWTNHIATIGFCDNIPWLGSIPFFNLNPHVLYKEILRDAKKHNHLYVTWMGPSPRINIGRVEYIQAVIRSGKSEKSGLYKLFTEWLGFGLFTTATNEKWKKRRAALTPAFHFSILQDQIEIQSKYALNLVHHIRTHADTSESIDIQEFLHLASLDVICETSMGVKINALDSSDSEYVRAIGEIKALLTNRLFKPLHQFNTIYKLTSDGKRFYKHLKTVHYFTIDVINKRINERNRCLLENENGR